MNQKTVHSPFNIIVIVAALGYFVDIYDLILFGIVRQPSLRALGVSEANLLSEGHRLLNMQMIGMLIGGIIWGILGDKRGRLSTLFLTILLYSIANIANGFVQTIEQYAWLRFIAGVGLAGELGVGITLVSEVMSKETRGYGTSIVSGVGIAGAALGYLVKDWFDWRVAYLVGGGLGIALLILRISVYESGMYSKIKHATVKKGSFFKLFTDKKRFTKYLHCILIGVPVWYVIGVIVFSSPEFAHAFNITGTVDAGKGIMYHYIGAALGSFATGLISQWLRSRRKSIFIALTVLSILLIWFFSINGISVSLFYFILFALGIAQGYWAVFITVASEQFGTNIRATVATTVPNFVRGSTVLMTLTFEAIKNSSGILTAGIAVGVVVISLAFFSTYKLHETYGKELDYLEPV